MSNSLDEEIKDIQNIQVHELEIKIGKLSVRNHKKKQEKDKINELNESDIKNMYLQSKYYLVEEFDFSSAGIDGSVFKDPTKMKTAFIKKSESLLDLFNPTTNFAVVDKINDNSKKKSSRIKRNINFLLKHIFHKKPVKRSSNSKDKFSVSSVVWDGNFKEELGSYKYSINVDLVIISIIDLPGINSLRSFCQSNKEALKSAIRKRRNKIRPNTKKFNPPTRDSVTNVSVSMKPTKGGKKRKTRKKTKKNKNKK